MGARLVVMARVAPHPEHIFEELVPPFSRAEAIVEAERCLECGGPYAKAPCVIACPAGVDVPGFVAERAAAADGPAFLNVLTNCPVGCGHEPRASLEILNAAVDTCFWPLYEVVDGRYRLTYVPERILPIEDWLRPQARFAHLLSPEGRGVVRRIQAQIDDEWAALRLRCEQDAAAA